MMRRRGRKAIAAALAVVAVAMLVHLAAPTAHEVVGVSMAPGLLPGDVLASPPFPLFDRRRPPRRFERWLFRAPSETTAGTVAAVKRVMGLEGDSMSIERGDLLVDGASAPPTPDVLAEIATPVWEDRPAAATGAGSQPGWTADSPAWRRGDGGHWRWDRPAAADGPPASRSEPPTDWLTYRHRVREPHGHRDTADAYVDAPILDDAPFAPEEHRRLLAVHDFGLAAVIRVAAAPGRVIRFLARIGDADTARTVSCNVAGPARLAFVAGRLDRHLVGAAWTLPTDGRPEEARRSALPSAAVGRWSLAAPWPTARNEAPSHAPPVIELGVASPRIATVAPTATVERLVVWRDTLHLPSADGSWRWSVGAGQVFLLGDFPPASRDSRQWGPIDAERLLHRVHTLHDDRGFIQP